MGENRTKRLKKQEQRGERLCKRLHRIANTCTLFLRGICKRELSLAREPPKDAEQSHGRSVSFSRCVVRTFHTISEPQVRT